MLMQHDTGDETADFLLKQIRFLGRVGSPAQKTTVKRWEQIVRDHAEAEPMAASFANQRPTPVEGAE